MCIDFPEKKRLIAWLHDDRLHDDSSAVISNSVNDRRNKTIVGLKQYQQNTNENIINVLKYRLKFKQIHFQFMQAHPHTHTHTHMNTPTYSLWTLKIHQTEHPQLMWFHIYVFLQNTTVIASTPCSAVFSICIRILVGQWCCPNQYYFILSVFYVLSVCGYCCGCTIPHTQLHVRTFIDTNTYSKSKTIELKTRLI